ncbi:ATP-binding protein [Schlesneria sp. DSM 10557]|uniref:ATP-binding protein n=1 Tax=Schlesneria sp. DSM 10557 TaxID=3044399 RepID=UPI0035A05B7A
MSLSEPTREMFAEHLRYSNPFDENRVTQTDSLSNDVPQIHADAFSQLTLRAEKTAQSDEMGCGVVVTGPPGVGKSHLLARFGDWARREKYPFVYLLNLQSGPQDILRTILRTSISILTKGLAKAPAQTRLYRLVSVALNQALAAKGITQSVELPTARQAYLSLLSHLDADPAIYRVLWIFFDDVIHQANGHPSNGRAELAKRWLSGGYLDPVEASQLELTVSSVSEEGCSLNLEQMKQVLKVLCQFAGFRRRSFILCFDQVDTLSEEQVQSWSATTHALLDTCPRLLVVTSGVDDTFIRWTRHQLMPQSSWDRIRQFTISLSGIDANAARSMVKDRLDGALRPFDTLPEISELRSRDPLFPLGEAWATLHLTDESGLSKIDLRPRQIINQAGTAWDHEAVAAQTRGVADWLHLWSRPEQTNETAPPVSDGDLSDLSGLIDQRIAAKIEEHRHSRLLRPEELPVDAGNVLGLLKSILAACETLDPATRLKFYPHFGGLIPDAVKNRSKPAFHLMAQTSFDSSDAPPTTIGVAIAEASSGLAATNQLKRILAALEGPNSPDRAILIVDGREPLQLAEAGRSQLNQLQQNEHRFTLQTLDFAQYAILDACEAVVGLARAGDLEVVLPTGESRLVTEAEVYDSHHRHQRYLSLPVICQLLGTCLDKPGVPASPMNLQQLEQAVCRQLEMSPGLTTIQLGKWWIDQFEPDADEQRQELIHEGFKEVVLKLHDEDKLHATAINDYYQIYPTFRRADPTT